MGRLELDQIPESPLKISIEEQNSSSQWMVWGYPEDVLFETVVDDRAVPRPELVYVSGYVRRQVPSSVEIPKVRGRHLYESGGLAGQGCSGAPVILQNRLRDGDWPVIGIYLGERLSVEKGLFVSYAARADRLATWRPEVLGRSLAEESYA